MSTDDDTMGSGDSGRADVAAQPSAAEASGPGDAAAELATAQREKKETWDKYLRAVADLDNLRKRQRRELDDARSEARAKVLREMLPVVDNLERAIEHGEQQAQSAENTAMVEGIRLVLRQFTHAFERLEVTAIEAKGATFDPNLHEAISQEETDQVPPHTIVSVLQRGYRNGDRLLRPAMVVVAKAKTAVASDPAGGGDGSKAGTSA